MMENGLGAEEKKVGAASPRAPLSYLLFSHTPEGDGSSTVAAADRLMSHA